VVEAKLRMVWVALRMLECLLVLMEPDSRRLQRKPRCILREENGGDMGELAKWSGVLA
jgi:hypothetical protein